MAKGKKLTTKASKVWVAHINPHWGVPHKEGAFRGKGENWTREAPSACRREADRVAASLASPKAERLHRLNPDGSVTTYRLDRGVVRRRRTK
jgi:hypothetical protein